MTTVMKRKKNILNIHCCCYVVSSSIAPCFKIICLVYMNY